jgi:hypothetical protein
MTSRQAGPSVPGPAAGGHADARLPCPEFSAHHGLVTVERHLSRPPARSGGLAAGGDQGRWPVIEMAQHSYGHPLRFVSCQMISHTVDRDRTGSRRSGRGRRTGGVPRGGAQRSAGLAAAHLPAARDQPGRGLRNDAVSQMAGLAGHCQPRLHRLDRCDADYPMLLAQRDRWVRGTVDEWRNYGWFSQVARRSSASMILALAVFAYMSTWVAMAAGVLLLGAGHRAAQQALEGI